MSARTTQKIESNKSPTATRPTVSAAVDFLKHEAGDEWLPEIYRSQVRTLRTRSARLDVPEKENRAEIQYTLLGVELKIGKLRITCPDLATARYLQVFARIGCAEVAIPYDITKISVLADALESAWQRSLLVLEQKTAAKDARSTARARSLMVKIMRAEIVEIGAGEAIPQFRQNTKQRKS